MGKKYCMSSNNKQICSSPNIIRVIISSRMNWMGVCSRDMERRNSYKILIGKSEWKLPDERYSVEGRIILN
jgi:hypothetical protein